MKIFKPQPLILFLSLFVLFIVWMKYQNITDDENSANVEINNTLETASIDSSLILSDASTYTTAADSDNAIPDSYQLDVPYISQYPELPTGCEITALTEALHYYQYDVDKESLASNYLPMKSVRETGCFINYFYGSPWSSNGSGCFAPAITTAANGFLTDAGSSLKAYTLSYSSVKSLFEEIADGHPVIVWTSFEFDDTDVSYNEITLDSGQTFSWPENEHCVVLSGYNLTDNTVTVADPTYGIVTHSIDVFTYFYQKYYYQAVVIK